MISREEVRAICRIDVGTSRRGTGFVVDLVGRRVVTASHVLAKPGDPLPPAAAIAVTFAVPPGEAMGTSLRVTHVEAGSSHDYAVLTLEADPGCAKLECEDLFEGHGTVWSTFGFGHEAPMQGRGYDGTVRVDGDELVQVQFAGVVRAEGLSGAPCIVNGRVVGIFQQADPVTGAAMVIPIRRIAESCVWVRLPPEPPYVLFVADKISGAPHKLLDAAKALGLPPVPDGARPRLTAREMMRNGVPSALAGLLALVGSIERAVAEHILGIAKHVWIDRASVKQVASVMFGEGPQRVMLLNTVSQDVSKWYAARARCRKLSYPGEAAVVETLVAVDPDTFHDEVAQAVARKRLKPGATVLVVVAGMIPPATTLQGVLDEDPRVRFLLLVERITPELEAEFAGALVIDPPIPADQPGSVLRQHADALSELSQSYQQLMDY